LFLFVFLGSLLAAAVASTCKEHAQGGKSSNNDTNDFLDFQSSLLGSSVETIANLVTVFVVLVSNVLLGAFPVKVKATTAGRTVAGRAIGVGSVGAGSRVEIPSVGIGLFSTVVVQLGGRSRSNTVVVSRLLLHGHANLFGIFGIGDIVQDVTIASVVVGSPSIAIGIVLVAALDVFVTVVKSEGFLSKSLANLIDWIIIFFFILLAQGF